MMELFHSITYRIIMEPLFPRNYSIWYSSKYVLSDIMVCGECGQPYRRTTWTRYGEKLVVWRYNNRLKNGTKHCKNSPTMKEKQLHEAIISAINGVIDNENDYVSAFRENVILIMGAIHDYYERFRQKVYALYLETREKEGAFADNNLGNSASDAT